jgi:hypothetical protein
MYQCFNTISPENKINFADIMLIFENCMISKQVERKDEPLFRSHNSYQMQTTGATSGVGTAYPSAAPEFTPDVSGVHVTHL